jgi:hypothetical protein
MHHTAGRTYDITCEADSPADHRADGRWEGPGTCAVHTKHTPLNLLLSPALSTMTASTTTMTASPAAAGTSTGALLTTKRLANALVAHANAKQGEVRAQLPDCLQGDPRIHWSPCDTHRGVNVQKILTCALVQRNRSGTGCVHVRTHTRKHVHMHMHTPTWARRHQNASRIECTDLLHRHLVVLIHHKISAKVAQILRTSCIKASLSGATSGAGAETDGGHAEAAELASHVRHARTWHRLYVKLS